MLEQVNKILVIRLHSNMAKAISTQNINISAFGFDDCSKIEDIRSFPTNINIIPGNIREPKAFFDDFHNAIALMKVIRIEQPEVIHVNALQDLPFTVVATHLFWRFKSRPRIIAMSRNPRTWENPSKAWLGAMMIRLFTDGFVCLATTHQNQLLSLNVQKEKMIVIPNPYDIDQMKIDTSGIKSHSEPGSPIHIVYIANVCERKAQDVLVDAATLVIKKHPEVNFDMIGRVIAGEEKFALRVYAQIQAAGMEKNVHMLGALPYNDVLARVAGSDIFAFPTRSEMMPRAVIEAMVAGKPVVASGVDGILDLIEHRRTGLLVQPSNPEELADALCELIDNPSMAHLMGLAGQKHVLEFCSPQRIGAMFKDFYGYILNNRGGNLRLANK